MEGKLVLSTLLILFFLLPIQSYCEELNQRWEERECTYVIYIKTGDIRNAGTFAKVSLVLRDKYSNRVNISNFQNWGLMDDQWYEYFQRSNFDMVAAKAKCLKAPPCSITLSHDNSGYSPSWYVEFVDVTTVGPHTASGCRRFKFPVNAWLAFNEPPYYSPQRGVYLCDDVVAASSERLASLG